MLNRINSQLLIILTVETSSLELMKGLSSQSTSQPTLYYTLNIAHMQTVPNGKQPIDSYVYIVIENSLEIRNSTIFNCCDTVKCNHIQLHTINR